MDTHQDVAWDRSYLLGWFQSERTLVLFLEVALRPPHPASSAPKRGELHGFRYAVWTFEEATWTGIDGNHGVAWSDSLPEFDDVEEIEVLEYTSGAVGHVEMDAGELRIKVAGRTDGPTLLVDRGPTTFDTWNDAVPRRDTER